jgi:hypothetical protein
MTQNHKTEDHELDSWREQWSSVAGPSPEFRRQVQEKITAKNRHFWLGNLLTVAAFGGALIFALYQFRYPESELDKSAATGVFVLLFVSVICRLWIMRGTWRAETRSTRAFVELWRRRALAQIRALQISIYVATGWLVFCAGLGAANWKTIRLELTAHPIACLALTVIIVITLPLIWLVAMWLRRRKVAELNQVTRLLEEMETMND